jgi:hypothetical protein
MKKSPSLLMLVTLGMVAAACGGGTKNSAATPSATTPPATTSAPPATSGPPCTPSGTTLQISAKVTQPTHQQTAPPRFDKDCLAAPADTAFEIDFDNKGTERHNVSIYTNIGASTALFKGKIIAGPKKITYSVRPLPAGNYYFRCDVHSIAMHGTFVVSG